MTRIEQAADRIHAVAEGTTRTVDRETLHRLADKIARSADPDLAEQVADQLERQRPRLPEGPMVI